MYKIDIRRQAQRTLDRLSDSDFRAVVKAIEELGNVPRPRGIEKVKTTGLWRIRQGDYRIIFSIEDKLHIVTIVRVGHRREIYKAL